MTSSSGWSWSSDEPGVRLPALGPPHTGPRTVEVKAWEWRCGLQRPLGGILAVGFRRALTSALCSHPCPAPPPGLRGTLDLQVIRVRMEEPPAVSLLQDWSKHPQGAKSVGAGDPPNWPAVLSDSSTTVGGQPEAGGGV